jgi:hypothetical protein
MPACSATGYCTAVSLINEKISSQRRADPGES